MYAEKKIMEHSQACNVLLVSGNLHTHRITENLKANGWSDYRCYGNGNTLPIYELKRSFDLVSWKDRLAQLCNCGWAS